MGWWYWLDVKEILLDHETLNALGLAQPLANRDVSALEYI
jgi:hypothetical protein